MFETHIPPEPDKILRVMAEFAADPRPDKIDLGVGVYRSEAGTTPVLRAVKAAEARLLDEQTTKGYVGLAGDPHFHAAMRTLVLGNTVPADRIAALATPGGTGAVRQAFELIRLVRPGAVVHTSAPTWPNHESILDTLKMPWRPYRYYDPATGGADAEGMMADLDAVAEGDVVLLHGCCHNPTGADLSVSQWVELADLLARRGAVPMIDLAYQGFGMGLDADVEGLRALAQRLPEALITLSGSKNFGLYRDRVGLVLALCDGPTVRDAIQGRLAWLNRQTYAFPPDHGAAVVTTILGDAGLRGDWEAELGDMRSRILSMRQSLAVQLRSETGSERFDFLTAHQGMFSRIGATPEQVLQLREQHAVYMVGDGRINMAGLTPGIVAPSARAIAAVLG
ncbi:aromatic amino acid aminotransferase [Aliiruegeria haliotis]|uniref:Aromatic amino acid aminotransferase n=1 Tax=Aliiruegeria haliotis TaxID=1280846 RepID=A0A2T0RT55_9RHOB|nr:amino acid aminotransferase [Aliiruegeria haliotis]PRY24364.1 aromatic amino acid aminotransferase [Aliiruegeria haliotis]